MFYDGKIDWGAKNDPRRPYDKVIRDLSLPSYTFKGEADFIYGDFRRNRYRGNPLGDVLLDLPSIKFGISPYQDSNFMSFKEGHAMLLIGMQESDAIRHLRGAVLTNQLSNESENFTWFKDNNGVVLNGHSLIYRRQINNVIKNLLASWDTEDSRLFSLFLHKYFNVYDHKKDWKCSMIL